MDIKNLPALDRFNMSYVKAANGCWEWKAKHQRYGRLRVNGKITQAHRFSYLTFKGEIPKNINVCHKCDNTYCVNPDHLFLGTQKENHDDMVAKGRRASFVGEKNGNSKLTKQDVENIVISKDSLRKLAKQYGVTHCAIYQIKKRRSWNELCA